MRRGGSAGWTNGTAHGSAGGRTTASMTPHGSGAPAPASPSCLFQAGNVTRTDRQFQESEPPPPTGSIGLRGSRNISVSQAMNECRRGTHVLRARARTCRSAPDADVPPLPAVGACRGGRRRRNAAQLRATPRLAGRHSHATGDDGQPQLPGTRRSHGRGDPARGRGRRGNATQRPGRHPWPCPSPSGACRCHAAGGAAPSGGASLGVSTGADRPDRPRLNASGSIDRSGDGIYVTAE